MNELNSVVTCFDESNIFSKVIYFLTKAIMFYDTVMVIANLPGSQIIDRVRIRAKCVKSSEV